MQSACTVFYCYLSSIWLYHILSHFLVNGTIFGSGVIEYNIRVLISLQHVSEAFLILRRTERDIIINVHMPVFM